MEPFNEVLKQPCCSSEEISKLLNYSDYDTLNQKKYIYKSLKNNINNKYE